MTRTQIYLPDELHRQLKLLAARKNTNISKLLRLGAQKVLTDEKLKKPDKNKFLGTISGGPENLSATIDEVLY